MSDDSGIAAAARRALARALRGSPLVQRLRRHYLRRRQHTLAPRWAEWIGDSRDAWERARASAREGPKVLIATGTGGHPSSPLMESLLGAALTLRGANVQFLLCDSFLPGCMMAETRLMAPRQFADRGPQGYFCRGCFAHASTMYDPLGLPVHRLSERTSPEARTEAAEIARSVPYDDVPSFTQYGIPVGEHASAGALRYFARADLTGQPYAEAVLRRYLEAALLTRSGTQALLTESGFDAVCLNHALYVPQGIVAAVARAAGCRVTSWNVAYRKQSFIFSHGETYHHTMMSEPVSMWEDIAWTDELERQAMEYLTSRRRSGRDWIAFQARNPEEDLTVIWRDLGIDPSRPVVGMLTNVAWDAQLHYPTNAFRDMLDWVRKTIAYFATRPELQLIIRVHPAEVTGGIWSRQPVVEEIDRAFPRRPANVFVIPPDSPIGTYAVMEACNAVIIYGTKTGVELTSLGLPVIVAGEAWIRNKGVTLDATSEDHYFRILDGLPIAARLTPGQITRARKYAYHFFFRRMIPVSQVAPTGMKEPQFQIAISGLEELRPGNSRGLDIICDGILRGTPFVYPAEQMGSRNDGR
jgi:hypothetical protein